MSNALSRLVQQVLGFFRPAKQTQQLLGETADSIPFNGDSFLRNPGPVVYLVQYGDWPIYKIGHTTDFQTRLNRIRLHMPHPVRHIHCINTNDPKWLEAKWHRVFAHKRRIGSGIQKASEWFDLSNADVQEFKSHPEWNNPALGVRPQLSLFTDEEHKPFGPLGSDFTPTKAEPPTFAPPRATAQPPTSSLHSRTKAAAVGRVAAHFDKQIAAHPDHAARLTGARNWQIAEIEDRMRQWRASGYSEAQALKKWEQDAYLSANSKLK